MNENVLNQKLADIANYQGSFAADELNQIKLVPKTLVTVNLDKRSETGSHWIGLYIDKHMVIICDSLGGIIPSAEFPHDLVQFLYRLTISRQLIITKQLQPDNSSLCGFYVVHFIRELSRGSFYDFISVFSNNLRQNDILIKFLV